MAIKAGRVLYRVINEWRLVIFQFAPCFFVFQPPELTGLPGTDFDGILDSTTTETYIDVFTVTDSDDVVTCSIDAGDPSASVFELRAGTGDGTMPIGFSWQCIRNS